MPEDAPGPDRTSRQTSEVRTAEQARQRRLRAARLLGDIVPATTRDETAEGWSEREGGRDEEMRRDVPPHHGG
ncbi:hypothetical protein KV100_13675 [Mumia sp. zg.B21]|uniref:hypothetical protein n=1 Tax=Mumia sp. zg.B21 TaxID=2855447 RepID=UPI001C6EF617|nr:hypothetical protein [Mumia sp. zg.B21]MBW9210705.1 hypothetical protein [Mumia sp. zg.B21]